MIQANSKGPTSFTESGIETSSIAWAQLNKFIFNHVKETDLLSEMSCFYRQQDKTDMSNLSKILIAAGFVFN